MREKRPFGGAGGVGWGEGRGEGWVGASGSCVKRE